MPAPENLTPQVPGDTTGATPNAGAITTNPRFQILHKGGGRYVVTDAQGNQVGEFIGTKAQAEAEVERLLAGGDPFVKSGNPISTTTPASPLLDTGNSTDPEPKPAEKVNPAKIAVPVLTDEGWVCPEK